MADAQPGERDVVSHAGMRPAAAGGHAELDAEIDEWEQEQARQQRVFDEVAAQERRTGREDAILERLFGEPPERPPTRWSKPAQSLRFYAEAEFLRRTPRLSETVFAPEQAKPEGEHEAARRLRRSSAAAPSVGSRYPDAKSPDTAKKPRTPALRRSRSSLHMISEAGEQIGDREPGAKREGTDRGLWSRGSQGSSRAGPRPRSTDAASAAQALFSGMKFFSPFKRSVTPQTPGVARKYGELSESNVKALVGSSASERTPSRGGIIKLRGVHNLTERDSLIHPFPGPARPETEGKSRAERTAEYEHLVVGAGTQRTQYSEAAQAAPPVPEKTPTKVKLFNQKTGKWSTGINALQEIYKDGMGHGNTVYPRLPQVFDDPAHAVADALLHAKTPEETKMVLDKIAMDLRPGSFAAGEVDFEASVGLVLTDDFHGAVIELIEAESSASECNDILRGDYVTEVNDSDVRNRSADQVESMLMGREGTTVSLLIQTEHFGKPRRVTLMRKSLGAEMHTAPKEFFRKEEELIWGCGYNKFGNLSHANFEDSAAPVLCPKKLIAQRELKGRIQMVACGWYHTVIVARQKWTTKKPIEFDKVALKDPEQLSTEEIATALCDWASPSFRKNARQDTELPDDPQELMETFDRKEISSMYMRMVEQKSYGSAKKLSGVFSCGLNKSGQLGLGHREDENIFEPVERLIGEKVDSVACGGHHTLLLMQTGAVLAFGANSHGQLGNGTVFGSKVPQIVSAVTHESTRNPAMPTPSRVLFITNLEMFIGKKDIQRNFGTCFGYQQTVIRSRDQTTVPGDRDVEERDRPCALVFFMDTLTAAHAMRKYQGKVPGEQFTKLEMHIYFFHPHQAGKDSTAWAMTKMHRSPCLAPIGSYVKQIAAGYDHSMALLTNGQVIGWGHNNWGQVGTQPLPGLDPEIALRMKELPENPHLIQVDPVILPFTRKPYPGEPNVSDPEKVKLMAVGGNHNLFLLEDGRVMACGRNDNKQLGFGPSGGKVYHQVVEVIALDKFDVRTLCAGASHSLAVLHDGRVLSWGRNDSFQCGHYDTGGYDVSLPKEIEVITETGKPVIHVSANEHTFLVCEDFKVFAWGLNANGQLGLAHRNRNKGRVEYPTWSMRGIYSYPLVGAFHTLIFNRLPLVSGQYQFEDRVYSWGYNKHGELGLGITTETFRSLAVGSKTPALIPGLHMREIEQMACGWYHTLCIYHDQRDLRHGLPPPSSEAEPDDGLPEGMVRSRVAPKTPVKKTDEGGFLAKLLAPEPPKQHLVGWGYNRRGQLGLGHSESQTKPVKIDLQKWGVETRITHICCGGMASYIVTENRDVFAFGNNSKGQLGYGESGGRQKTPVKITKLCGKHIQSLAAGYDHCFAVVSNLARSEIYSWGANAYGQLGLHHLEDVYTPTYVPALTKVSPHQVACGGQHTIAVATHAVWAMGRNDFGQLGQSHKLPIEPAGPCLIKFLSNAIKKKTTTFVACGASHSLFVLANGEMLGCGRNDLGQLGLGHWEEALKPTWILTEELLNGHQVTTVTASDHTLVSLSNGEVIGCGCNHNGQLGLGHTIMTADFQTLPLDSMRANIRAGAFHSIASYAGPHPRRARNASAAVAASSGVCAIS